MSKITKTTQYTHHMSKLKRTESGWSSEWVPIPVAYARNIEPELKEKNT